MTPSLMISSVASTLPVAAATPAGGVRTAAGAVAGSTPGAAPACTGREAGVGAGGIAVAFTG